jgi:hypothetical protein
MLYIVFCSLLSVDVEAIFYDFFIFKKGNNKIYFYLSVERDASAKLWPFGHFDLNEKMK